MALTKEQVFEAFQLFDVDGSGHIDRDELALALKGLGMGDIPKHQVAAIMHSIDANNDGKISFTEFELIIQQQMPKAGSTEEIWKAYKLFDTEQKGRITLDNLRAVAAQEGTEVPESMLEKILSECAESPTKGITFEEWRAVMTNIMQPAKRGSVFHI